MQNQFTVTYLGQKAHNNTKICKIYFLSERAEYIYNLIKSNQAGFLVCLFEILHSVENLQIIYRARKDGANSPLKIIAYKEYKNSLIAVLPSITRIIRI